MIDIKNLDKNLSMTEKYLNDNNENKEALEFLKSKYKNQRPGIIEYYGYAYQNTNFFGTVLGYRSLLGWTNHEFTWRNFEKYNEKIEQRQKDIKEVYSGESEEETKNILNKYQINLIVVGKNEKQELLNKINYIKLGNLSNLVFENKEIKIYEYNSY